MTIASKLGPSMVPTFPVAAAGVLIRVSYLAFAGAAPSLTGLNPIAQPNRAAFQHFAACKRNGSQRGCRAGFVLAGIKDAWRAFRAIDGRKDCEADLVDEPSSEKGAVGDAAAIHLQALDAEFAAQDVERKFEIERAPAGEDIRNPILTQPREVGVADLFGQNDHNRIAADIAATPDNFAPSVEHNAVSSGFAACEPGFPRVALVGARRISIALGVFLTGDTADEPGIDAQPVVQWFEMTPPLGIFRAPPTGQRPAIDAGHHMADHVRLHRPLFAKSRT